MDTDEITELQELGAEKVSGVGSPANGTPWLLLKAMDPESPHTSADLGETGDIIAALKQAEGMGFCYTDDCEVCKDRLGPIYEFLIKRKLSAADRKKIPRGKFAIPEKAPGSGSYPINDESHARNALSRSSGKPVAARVRAAVAREYPNIGKELEALEKSPGVPEASVATPQEAGHLMTGQSGLAGPMTAGTKPIPGSPSYALGGESPYVIPTEAKVTDHPPLEHRPRVEAEPVSVGPDTRGHTYQGAPIVKDSWELEVVEKQNWVSLDNPAPEAQTDVASANNTVLRCMADTYIQLKACMAAQKADPDGMSDPMDAQVWAHLEDVCATLKNALVDQAFDVAGLDAQMLKTAGNGAETSEEETMTTVTKEDLASAIAESTLAAIKADRKAQAAKSAKKAKQAKKGKATKNANNCGDITAEEMSSKVHGHADADDVNAIPNGGQVRGEYINKEGKPKGKDKELKVVKEQVASLTETVRKGNELLAKMAGRPRSGGPVLDGVAHGAGVFPASDGRQSTAPVLKSGEEPEIERLQKAVEEDRRTGNSIMLDQHSRELTLAMLRHGHQTGQI